MGKLKNEAMPLSKEQVYIIINQMKNA